MKIRLIIFSNLKNYVEGYKDKEGVLKVVSNRKTIRQFLEETISHERAIDVINTVIVNDQLVPFKELNRYLQDGDVIKIYPPMGGG
ncbi:MAG: MoaD/ThiS family protein [Atribacterota bacterium]